jgi:hypothetical protein
MTNDEAIAANAEIVKKTFAAEDLAFDQRSVQWIDGYIQRNRESWDAATAKSLGGTLGSFLGECIRANFGGEWEMTEYGMAIVFDDQNNVFPFNKINKHIANGEEDSIASFYDTIAALRGINYA